MSFVAREPNDTRATRTRYEPVPFGGVRLHQRPILIVQEQKQATMRSALLASARHWTSTPPGGVQICRQSRILHRRMA